MELELYDDAVLRDVGFETLPLLPQATWQCTARVHWEAGTTKPPNDAASGSIKVTLTAPDGREVASKTVLLNVFTPDERGRGHTDVTFTVQNVSVRGRLGRSDCW